MKLQKKGLKIAAVALMLGAMPLNVLAAQHYTNVPMGMNAGIPTPYWAYFSEVVPYAYTSGNTVYADVYATAEDRSKKISGTMSLQKYGSGRWSTVASWSVSGTGYLSATKEYTKGIDGVSYRTRVAIKIGTEKVDLTSDACTV